jgi:hypothetical protein
MVLAPRRGMTQSNDAPRIEPRLVSMAQAAVQVYELDYHEESQGFFFARGDQAWGFGPWSSDARVLYCRVEQEKLTHLILIGGTYVAWQGQQLLSAAGPSSFFEWRQQDAVMNAAPGEFSVTALFEEMTGGAGSPLAGQKRNSSSFAEKH